MIERTAATAAEAMAGTVVAGDPAAPWSGAALDSRRLGGGEIFFALPGEQADGHDFVADAARRGAAVVVVHRDLEPPPGVACIRVDDTFKALHALTVAVRRHLPRQLVGITGSMGKTTTKEFLAAILGRRFRVARSPGNLNNLYGFPLALLNVPADCEWMVAEMGMSTPGELAEISRLGRPDAVLFTNVRPVHLENFPSVEAIAEAKGEIFAGLRPGGLVVANADDPQVMRIVTRRLIPPRSPRRATGPLVRYAVVAEAEVRATPPQPLGGGRVGSRFTLSAAGESVTVELPVHGLYNAENCLAAAACGHALGVPLAEAAAAVADFRPGEHRGEIYRLAHPDGPLTSDPPSIPPYDKGGRPLPAHVTLIDDCYNSNPDAAEKALRSARQLPARRYLAVLGDMRELGPEAPDFHRRLGEVAVELGFAPLAAVGELAAELAAAAEERGTATARFATADEAAAWAPGAVRGGDLVLVKGSRAVGLEVVVDALRSALGEAP